MSALLLSALAAGSSGQSALYVDDVFSTYLYTGNGSTQTINNGIDLAGKGGLVWVKTRSVIDTNCLFDTNRGPLLTLQSNTTDAQFSGANTLTAFNSNGFSLGSSSGNGSGYTYASWTFRKAAKFFDVVTYTGDGTSNRQIAHGLGVPAGFITVKASSVTGDWNSYHRSATGDLKLNLTDAQTASRAIIAAADASTFTVSGAANTNGVSYVAYLWAHDPSADGIIQCGSFTYSSGTLPVNLGWEPQYVLVKPANQSGNWETLDAMRGLSVSKGTFDNTKILAPNTSSAEQTGDGVTPTTTGFEISSSSRYANSGYQYIYLAIRRPNKPPTSGTQVYNAIARTGTGAAATVTGVGFAPDLVIPTVLIPSGGNGSTFHDRLRGKQNILFPSGTNVELARTDANMYFRFGSDGIEVGADSTGYINYTGHPYINWFFRRAKGFFDLVCDTGTGVAHGVNHGLSAAPEFIIRKSRSGATHWECWHSALTATEKLVLNSTAAKVTDATAWNSTLPTSTQFTVGTGANVNTNAATYVTYLFATLAGISKVGSYTGNGTSQTINCGFATGARFILIKRTDATDDWYVWDSVRGIIAANDPHLSLNTTAAEVTTDDSVDPEASGFIVNQNTATNINVNGGSYIFLAIA